MQKTPLFSTGLVAIALHLAAQGCTVHEYAYEDALVPDAGPADIGSSPDVRMSADAPMHDAARLPDTSMGACAAIDLHSEIGARVAMGTTLGATDRHTPMCSSSASPDAWFTWTAPMAGNWTFDTEGSDFDTVIDILSGCTGSSLGCDDDGLAPQSRADVRLTLHQSVVIIVDGYGSQTGHYLLNIGMVPTEICNDSIDNDGDVFTDCEDPDCATDPLCDESMHCTDHIDNDVDFFTDCEDSDCSSQMVCLETGVNCADGLDNDMDGHIDCADSDCASITSCNEAMNCGDFVDNDRDDLVDCADSDCATNALCMPTETNCNNGLDDDRDGLVDCSDSNCAAHCTENTVALCMDTLDNDSDTFTDCADRQCSCSTACPPAVAPSTTCPDMSLAMAVGDGVYHGTLMGYACGARADASCGTTHGAGAEIELAWTAPANGTYVFDTEDSSHAGGVFDTVLTLRTGCAGGAAAEFACDDDGGSGHLSRTSHYLVAGEAIVIVIDAANVWDGGNVTLNIHAR